MDIKAIVKKRIDEAKSRAETPQSLSVVVEQDKERLESALQQLRLPPKPPARPPRRR